MRKRCILRNLGSVINTMLNRKLVKIFIAVSFAVILSSVESFQNLRSILCDGRYLNDDIKIDGKVALVTGGTSGFGLATAKDLAKRGGRVYLAAHDEKEGKKAVESIQETGNMNVKFIHLDLASLKSIRQFSETFHSIENRLDILVCNAELVSRYRKTEDEFEMNMGFNHLGHFLLTNLLLDMLKDSAPSRIIVVSSVAHRFGTIFRNNLNSELVFPGALKAYSNSKLANILFTRELARRLANTGVTANSLDPGFSISSFLQSSRLNNTFLRHIFRFLPRIFSDPINTAQLHIMLSVDPSVADVSGKYFKNCQREEPSYFARDDKMAEWLWDESAKLTRFYENQNRLANADFKASFVAHSSAKISEVL